jgi:hypothetical protein
MSKHKALAFCAAMARELLFHDLALANQHKPQVRLMAQCGKCARYRNGRAMIAAHGIQGDGNSQRSASFAVNAGRSLSRP